MLCRDITSFVEIFEQPKQTLVHTLSVICHRAELELKDRDHVMLKHICLLRNLCDALSRHQNFCPTRTNPKKHGRLCRKKSTEETKLHLSLAIICEKFNTKGLCFNLIIVVKPAFLR